MQKNQVKMCNKSFYIYGGHSGIQSDVCGVLKRKSLYIACVSFGFHTSFCFYIHTVFEEEYL